MLDAEILWLAGFLEGEGSFIFYEKDYGRNRRRQWIIQAVSTDEDVVQRAAAVLGGSVSGPYRSAKSTRPYWRVWLARRPDVIRACQLLRPEMGLRRQRQIDALLLAHANAETRKPGPRPS